MEKEKLNKKQIIPLVIGVLTMIILVSSATYAYFKVSIGNTATSTTITGDIGGDTIGTVTLSGGGTNLYLGVSADDMSESNKGTTYYSSTTEGSRETNVNNAGKTTYTATLSGDDTNEIMYACNYEFTVTSTGTALGKEHTSDISVVFEGDIKKTIPLSASGTVSGTWFGFKNSNAEREFNAYLQLSNTDSEQNSLAGTNLSVEIKNTKWNCYLSENDELVGEAYALYTESNQTLTFVRSETPINVGDTYNDAEITKVYTGVEQLTSSWIDEEIAWDGIYNVIFEDEIRPLNITDWFSLLASVQSYDVTNLNTSLITDMSDMRWGDYSMTPSITIEGLENWDVSNVTNMSGMFAGVIFTNEIDLTKWDVSNVINMENLFFNANFDSLNLSGWNAQRVTNMKDLFSNSIFNELNLSNWNVSNVTSMTNMFGVTTINEKIDLSNWNVSNVTNMSSMFTYGVFNDIDGLENWNPQNTENMDGMFEYAEINTDIDLTGWNVSSITSYIAFDENISGTGTLTPPNWPTTS